MITAVENGKEIARLQKRLVDIFKNQKPEYIEAIIGSPGGAFETTFLYFESHNFWAVFEKDKNRYWNAFGTGKPIAGKNNSIVCEINIPFEDINRRVAAVFGKEGDQVLLLHRGKIGGGRKGIGKNLFWENYRGEEMMVQDGDTENWLAPIGSFESKNFVQQVANFVLEIKRIKELAEDLPDLPEVETEDVEIQDFNYTFKEEGFGKRRYSRKDEIEAVSNHGIIINALAKQLTSRGISVGNDHKRDLFTLKDNQIDRVFEAKTDLSNSSIYSAVGQVLIYSVEKGLDDNQKILVLPEKLKASAEKILGILGLDILYYTFEEEVVRFLDLDEVLNKR
jgi:hypothetical protein